MFLRNNLPEGGCLLRIDVVKEVGNKIKPTTGYPITLFLHAKEDRDSLVVVYPNVNELDLSSRGNLNHIEAPI
jgi:hypothetical protein